MYKRQQYPRSFQHAGGEMIFTLPNGLHAYFITNSSGGRLDQAPTNIVVDQKGNPIVNGTSCMTCHDNGLIEVKEEVIDHSDPYVNRETINKLIREDNEKYWQAMNQILDKAEEIFGPASLYYREPRSYAAPQQPTFATNTRLLDNYPNPFNPETWIPYQLDQATDVTIQIHNVYGELVRSLDLGHQLEGQYRSQSRAAYWNGNNEIGERVASGIYFYTLITKNFIATRKMVIMK